MASETVLPSGEDQASSGIDDLQISLQGARKRTLAPPGVCGKDPGGIVGYTSQTQLFEPTSCSPGEKGGIYARKDLKSQKSRGEILFCLIGPRRIEINLMACRQGKLCDAVLSLGSSDSSDESPLEGSKSKLALALKHTTPTVVSDLFTDIQKGHVLLDLLEALSGQELPRDKGSNTFQCRTNIEHALTFLRNRSIKLINIHVTDIIDGNPSIILGLIWTIILHFHIEKLAQTLSCNYNQPSLDEESEVGSSPTASPPAKKSSKAQARWQMSAKKALLLWAQQQCATYESVDVTDFKSSWRNGMAFLAVIHALRPDLIDLNSVKHRCNRDNLKDAFRIAERELKIPKLLEPEDVDVNNPDEKSIMTYVAQFLKYSKDAPGTGQETQAKKSEDAAAWLTFQEEKLQKAQKDSENESYCKKYERLLSFLGSFNEEKQRFGDTPWRRQALAELSEDELPLRQAWDSLSHQINTWKAKLNQALPSPLDEIEAWLQALEHAVDGDFQTVRDFSAARTQAQEKRTLFKVPFETLSQWNQQHTAFNEVGHFLIEVSNDEVGSSISRELRRLNKRWKKFITKTQLDMHLPLIIKQSQSISDHSGNIQPSREDKSTIDFSQDMPIEAPKNHSPHSKAGEEQSTAGEVSPEPLKLGEDVERLRREVGVWETETKSVLDLLGHPDGVEAAAAAAAADSLQHLLAKGSLYEELVARAEDILQMDVQNILSQESLQYVLSAGLQAKIQEMKEKIQINMIQLAAMLKNSSAASSPEMDVRLKLEESQRELESHITRAAQLLEPRESTRGEISKYKEALMIFNSQSLAKYLKTVEELKSSVTEEGKLSLEERSREVCAKWESIHHELSLYIQQLKVDIEKGKLTETISKLEKQLNKEKKLIRRGRTKGLIKEHEAFFSEEGHLHQLDYHMQVLREICEELTSQKSQHQVKRALTDYQQKIERLRKSASEIHGALQATPGGVSRDKEGMNSSENGGGDAHSEAPFAKSDNPPPAEKAMEPMANVSPESELTSQHEACTVEEDEKGYSTPINSLLERYDMHRENLEWHLQSDRRRITSDFSSDKETSGGCLQEKLTDLQALKKETDACWKEFEITSLRLESLVNDMKKPVIAKARDRLKGQEQEFQMALNDRMESLELALQIVLPLEKESLCLCDSDLVLHELAIREFHLKDADSIYQNLKNIQDSLAKQIEICSHFEEPGNSALQELHPLDRCATHHIILNYKAQLEGLGHKVQRSEDALNVLEAFLASLRTAALPVELAADCAASETQVLPERSLTAEHRAGSVHLMRDKARHLDHHLQELDISLKDAELGEASSCEKLTDFVSTKCGAQEELRGDNKLLEMCVFKNNELLKNLQDVQNQMSKIGLKDPTIPAIKQRKKSLIRVDKDLDEYEDEKKHLQGMAASLPQFKDGREKALKQRCERTVLLWENTKASVAECLEQCERALELLKQYHNLKNILITLIQKEENVISLQASYLGKENLKKRIAEIEIVKEEFNEHLEDVDKINQICKDLQFHLNKMSTFEEPPFEKEANSIVDRWLDINEKTEDCYENLGRALALWEKLLTVRNVIDEWIEKALHKVKLPLTEEESKRLKEDLHAQEQELPEVFKRVAEVQFLLQTSEIPLELQMMESLILKKMEYVKMGLAGESRSCAFSGNPDGLREDLDQAKTQIGMTESLLHALSPSDSLEIFTKLEVPDTSLLIQFDLHTYLAYVVFTCLG
ncbi:nesprin-2-like [Echinops telfairi]|uniref:Nesprin-2-like n=1 Tax=Echinops telfairi TaxID=9371 RepID=A0AC55CVQ8_ECHTE|nr:nesprin-2-like [Echinops telfairi]